MNTCVICNKHNNLVFRYTVFWQRLPVHKKCFDKFNKELYDKVKKEIEK